MGTGDIQNKVFSVDTDSEGKRIDQFISESSGLTRSQVQRLIEKGKVTVADNRVKKNHKLKKGEMVIVEFSGEHEDTLIPQDIPLDIVYEDDFLTVMNKPAGMVMYPAAGHATGTLMNALAHHAKKLATIGGPLRSGVVHRLDKDTSGLVVVALDDDTYYALQRQFHDRTIIRNYTALIFGKMKNPSGEIDAPIGRAIFDRKRMSTRTRSGKTAITYYEVIEEFQHASHIQARLATGRTHQIRVHFASRGHPLLGDKTYGRKTTLRLPGKAIKIPRQMLHAQTLGFIHPVLEKEMSFSSPLPEDMEGVLEILRETKQ